MEQFPMPSLPRDDDDDDDWCRTIRIPDSTDDLKQREGERPSIVQLLVARPGKAQTDPSVLIDFLRWPRGPLWRILKKMTLPG